MSLGSKKSSSSSNTTTNTYDQRRVNDASNGGNVQEAGAIQAAGAVTTVSGSGNSVTDGGAFAIVDKLVNTVGEIAQAQQSVTRDLALRGTPEAAQRAAAEAQAATAAAWAEVPAQTWLAVAAGLGLVIYLARKKG